jgi:hypothetical protein
MTARKDSTYVLIKETPQLRLRDLKEFMAHLDDVTDVALVNLYAGQLEVKYTEEML